MKVISTIAACLASLTLVAVPISSANAQQSKMKSCADEWNKMKAANQTAGKSYRDFSKECMARAGDSGSAAPTAKPAATPPATQQSTSTPAAAPAAAKTTAPKADTSKTAAKPASPGREAMVARERACGADWKADKAAGKVAAGMTWPKYWSECDKRKKAAGM